MSCGERERDKAIASLQAQQLRDWDFFEIKDKPNAQAHAELYRTFTRNAPAYGFFLKLDADMVLRSDSALTTLKALFGSSGIDQVMSDVNDWPSGLLIPGMQAFSNRVTWPENHDPLMVDTTPSVSGKRIRVSKDPAPLADHMPDPSELQAFRYGIHRALKAIQPDRAIKKPARGQLHWAILKGIWQRYRAGGDDRRLYSLLGADIVLGESEFDRKQLLENYAGGYVEHIFGAVVARFGGDPAKGLSAAWENDSLNDARWLKNWEAPPWI